MRWWINRSDQLFQKAESLLDGLDLEGAEKIADTLIRRCYTGGFEIKARVLAERGDMAAAVSVLGDGLRHGPTVSSLWYWQGAYLSDLERFDEALSAFYRYRETGADEAMALYNLALVRSRMGDPSTAMTFLNEALSQCPSEVRFKSAKSWCHIQLEQYREAIELAESADPNHEHATLTAYSARAWLELGEINKAYETAWQSIKLDKTMVAALEVIRTQNPPISNETRACRVVVEGDIPDAHRKSRLKRTQRFFAVYWALCDSAEEALRFIRPFEPDSNDLEINAVDWLDDPPEGHKGVLKTLGTYFTYRA